ncbi:unnamed protein product [Rhizoctonia solani]|uniref:Nephrocystin 3-like N-terminal domain-containing protein n=1 Tax=Rhizoctonia solani TaxID=456999 RepID=A0A8H3B9X1_9AGAM|nr:unnamed protein product [Rhizoctonia solani]
MPSWKLFRKYKLDANSEPSSINTNGGTLRIPEANGGQVASFSGNDLEDWPDLHILQKTLTHEGPLRELVDELVKPLEIIAAQSGGSTEYEMLRDKLELLFKEIQELPEEAVCGHVPGPHMTKAMKWFCKSVKRELHDVRGIQDDNEQKQHTEGDNGDSLPHSYLRIQGHVRCIVLNIFATGKIRDSIVPSSSVHNNSKHKQVPHRGPCTQSTRVDVLDQIRTWVDNSSSGSVCWMSGMAGTGKTTIACSLCEEFNARGNLAASFFWSRPSPNNHSIGTIIHSIARQLADFSHPFHVEFSAMLQKDPNPQSGDPHLQFDALIARPLLQVKNMLPDNLIVVIDGLGGSGDESVRVMLEVLLARSSGLPLKFIVSSRPEPGIQSDQISLRLTLHELDRDVVQADIKTYLQNSLELIQPSEGEIAALVERAGVLFAFAGALVRYIQPEILKNDPRKRLASILEPSNVSGGKYCQEIDELYTGVLRSALESPNFNELDKDYIRQVLYLVVSAPGTLDFDTIASLIMKDTNQVRAALRPFCSVLHVSEDLRTVTTLHPSFSQYILDRSRSRQYHCDPRVYSQTVVLRCFRIFEDLPHQFNICNLDSSYLPDEKVSDLESRVKNRISTDLFYAAQSWAEHLNYAIGSPELLQRVEDFLSLRLLLWMEVMNLKKCSHLMPKILRLAEGWTESIMGTSRLRMLVHDALRFVTAFAFGEVRNSTPHIYTTMIALWPESSPVVRCYAKRIQMAFRVEGTAIGRRQFALLATWNFEHATRSPVYSPSGTQIGIGVGDKIWLFNASTGQMAYPPLERQGDTVLSLNFSPDGTRIVTSSAKGSIRVWNTQGAQTALEIVSQDSIASATFSPDGARIWGVVNDAIGGWDSYTGKCIFSPLAGYEPIFEIRCSPNGRWIATCGWSTIVLREVQDGQVIKTLQTNDTGVSLTSFDISRDGTHIVACSRGGGIYIWNTEKEKPVLGPLRTPYGSSSFSSVSFSPDGLLVFSGSKDGGIYLWNAQRGSILLGPLEGHTGSITSVRFSPDGHYIISGSSDKTIQLWDARNLNPTGEVISTRHPGHDCPVSSVGFSPDGNRIISGSGDQTICTWGIDVNDKCMVLGPTDKDISNKVLVSYSPEGARIISSSQSSVALLDAQKGNVLLGPINMSQTVQSAIFSRDGSRIIVAQVDGLVRVLAANSGEDLMVISPLASDQPDWVTSIAASPDGTRIAVGSVRHSLSMYDANNGALLYRPSPPMCCTNEPRSLTFSPDNIHVVSGSFSTILVWSVEDGSVKLGPLGGHKGWVHSVEYSPDGAWIVSGARDNAVCLWSAQTGQLVLGPIKWHTAPVRSVRFSPTGTCIVSGSEDRAIRVTDISQELQFVGLP